MSLFSIVVLLSGNGSNLQAIIDAKKKGLQIQIAAVISNQADAYGVIRAQHEHIPTHVICHQDYATREAFDRMLLEKIDRYQPQLIVLAGFMRRLTASFVQYYAGKIINIHPSLLPKYPGLHTHKQVLKNNDASHGVTIHFVTEGLDSGPIISQAGFLVSGFDNENKLKKRVHELEHQLYPRVLSWFAANEIALKAETVYFRGEPLPPNGRGV